MLNDKVIIETNEVETAFLPCPEIVTCPSWNPTKHSSLPIRSYNKRVLQLLFTVCCLVAATAFTQEPYLKNYTVSDGLPSNECYDLIQDHEGFIWIGTDRGLARFDGADFRCYSGREGLPDNLVTGLFVDRSNNLWCHIHRKGFCMVSDSGIVTPDYLLNLGPDANLLEDFIELEDGIKAFSVFSSENPSFSFLLVSPDGEISKQLDYQDSSHVISALRSGHSAAFAYHRGWNALSLTFVDGSKENKYDIKQSPQVLDIILDRHGNLIVALDSSVYALDTKMSFNVEDIVLNSMLVDSRNGLWVGCANFGVYYFPDCNLNQKPERFLTDKSVTSVIEDRDKGIWFSTHEQGIFYMPFRGVETLALPSESTDQRVIRSTATDSTIWVASRTGVVNRVLPFGDSIIAPIRRYRYVFHLRNDEGGVEAAVDSKATVFDPEYVKEHAAYYTSLSIGDDSVLYGGSSKVSIEYKGELVKELILWSTTNRILAIKQVNPKCLWLGTDKGLYKLQDTQAIAIDIGAELNGQRVEDIFPDEQRTFVAISGFGVLVISESDTTLIGTKEGLPSNYVNHFKLHNGKLWMSTTRGIAYILLNSITLEVHRPDIVLPFASVNSLEILGDSIWAMTDGGIGILPFSQLSINRTAPALYIKELRVNGIPWQDRFQEFSYEQNNLEIRYGAVCFADRKGVDFQYRVRESVDTQWNSTADASISLLQLSPGRYTVALRANHFSTGPGPIQTVSFVILPPWWMRWYVLLAAAAFILLLIGGFARYRIQNAKKAVAFQQEISELEHRALRAQMNPHFIYNALNAILKFIVQRDQTASISYLNSFSRLIRNVFDNSGQPFVPMEKDLETIQLYVELEAARYPERFTFSMDIDPSVRKLKIPPMIVQPFIENALLHGVLPNAEPGTVKLRMKRGEKAIEVMIEDNGVGILQSEKIKQRKSRFLARESSKRVSSGMEVTKSRLVKLSDNYGIEFVFSAIDKSEANEPQSGTVITFNLPFI